MSPRLVMFLIAAASVTAGRPASAQCSTPKNATSTSRTCSLTTTTNGTTGAWVVNKLGQMTLSSITDLALTTPTTAEYDVHIGTEPSGGSATRTVTIQANAPWTLAVAPNTVSTPSVWVATNDGVFGGFVAARTDKPSSDFMVGTAYSATASGYLSLPGANTGSTIVASGLSTNSTTVTLYWATVWIYELDKPGTYKLPLNVVLTLP